MNGRLTNRHRRRIRARLLTYQRVCETRTGTRPEKKTRLKVGGPFLIVPVADNYAFNARHPYSGLNREWAWPKYNNINHYAYT